MYLGLCFIDFLGPACVGRVRQHVGPRPFRDPRIFCGGVLTCAWGLIDQNSVLDICAVEAVKLEDLDPVAVEAGKKQAESELSKSTVSALFFQQFLVCLECMPAGGEGEGEGGSGRQQRSGAAFDVLAERV